MIASPLARPSSEPKVRRKRSDGKVVPLELRPPGLIGLCIHTTGSTIVAKAIAAGAPIIDHVVAYYLRPDSFFPTYVCGARGWRGMELVQVCSEDRIALHVGLSAGDISAYTEGTWRRLIDPAQWDRAWRPRYRTPLHLYRNSSPNRAYLGLELPPLIEPRGNGLRYTDEQHETVAELAADIVARYGLTPELRTVVGHEDLNPIGDRWNSGGGWDPGGRRARPWFDWRPVLRRLGLEGAGELVG